MNVFCKLARTIFVITLTLGALIACSGGGGGGGDDGNSGFTGVQTQAVINDDNAQQLILDAYNGGTMTDQLIIPMAAGGGQDQPLAPLGRIIFDTLPPLNFAPAVAPMATSGQDGPCGGHATISVSEGQTSASGSIVYENYCDGGVVLNGTVSFSAALNTQTDVVSMTMNFGNLTSAEGSLSGSISMSFNLYDDYAPMTMTMDMVLTDTLDQTYWIDNYTLIVTPGTTYDAAQFSGTYHDYETGYVVITTSTSDPLLIDDVTGIPESGTLHFAGAEGTWADLTATGGGGYTLTVSNGTVITGTF